MKIFNPICILATLAFSLAAFATYADDGGPITISNYTAGLVCGQDDDMRVCFSTTDIQLTGEGHCVYNRQPVACTWYGISFDYQLKTGEAQIGCDWTSSIPINNGNPAAELATNVSSGHYDFTLKSDEHHYFNPQYSTVDTQPGSSELGQIADDVQTCSYQGKVLFEIRRRLHYPER